MIARSYSIPALILTAFLAAGTPLASAQSEQASVSSFYTTSLSARSAYLHDPNAQAPIRISTFAPGTGNVAYFFQFSGVTPNVTQFQVIEHDPSGQTIKGQIHTLHHTAGSFTNYFFDDPAFAPGTYTLNLVVDGKQAATTSFTVKPGFVVLSVTTTTKADIDSWKKSTSSAAPRSTTTFPSGTSNIGYYLTFAGATPKVSTFQVNIYHQDGSLLLKGAVHTLHHLVGSFGNSFYDQPAFPNGAYRVSVLVNGRPVRSSTFSVGS